MGILSSMEVRRAGSASGLQQLTVGDRRNIFGAHVVQVHGLRRPLDRAALRLWERRSQRARPPRRRPSWPSQPPGNEHAYGRNAEPRRDSTWLSSLCSVAKVPSCRMIIRYAGLQFGLQFAPGRAHSLKYAA
jgi:hypothetical protein